MDDYFGGENSLENNERPVFDSSELNFGSSHHDFPGWLQGGVEGEGNEIGDPRLGLSEREDPPLERPTLPSRSSSHSLLPGRVQRGRRGVRGGRLQSSRPKAVRIRQVKVKIAKQYKRRITDSKLWGIIQNLDSRDLEVYLENYIYGTTEEAESASRKTRLDTESLGVARWFLRERLFKCADLKPTIREKLASEKDEHAFKSLALGIRANMRHQKTSNTTRAIFPKIVIFLWMKIGKLDPLQLPDHDALNTKQFLPILRDLGLVEPFFEFLESDELRKFVLQQSRLSFKTNISIWASKMLADEANVIRMGVIPLDYELAIKAFMKLRGFVS